MKKAIALLATAALALSFTSVAGASMAPVTSSKAPTVVSFKVTPNRLPASGGVVTLVAKVRKATTCTFAGDGTLTLKCASGKAEATVTVAPNRLSVPKVFNLTLVARNSHGADKKWVTITEAPLAVAPTTTVATTTPPTTTPAAPSTQLTGPGKFTFPTQNENGIASISLNAVTQGVPCPDDSMFGACDATPAQQIDDVNVSACAGQDGATDVGFGVPDEMSLDLTNATQASRDSVTEDSSVPTAFGNYATLAPGQCVTGDVYFDVTSGAQWLSLNYSYTAANFQSNAVYVWQS
jgi:hypothetical protein